MEGSMIAICRQFARGRTFLLGRSVNVQQVAGLRRSAMEKLGLPLAPTKPMSSFFKYLETARPKLAKSNPDASKLDISRIAGIQWSKLSEQQKLSYAPDKKELDAYMQAMDRYKAGLTEEHKLKIKEAEEKLASDKLKRGIKQQMKEEGKPKRPATSFMLYLQENAPKRGNTPVKEWNSKIGERWGKLSAAEKAKYEKESSQLREEYNATLKKWEQRMIRKGNLALVRSTALDAIQAKAVANSIQAVKTKSSAAKKARK